MVYVCAKVKRRGELLEFGYSPEIVSKQTVGVMEIEVDISSNDGFVKLSWKSGNDWSYRYSIRAANVNFHSTKIREVLTAMNSELGRNNKADYSHYVNQLKQHGRDLYNALLPQNDLTKLVRHAAV